MYLSGEPGTDPLSMIQTTAKGAKKLQECVISAKRKMAARKDEESVWVTEPYIIRSGDGTRGLTLLGALMYQGVGSIFGLPLTKCRVTPT